MGRRPGLKTRQAERSWAASERALYPAFPAYEGYLAYRESPDDEIDDLVVRRSQRRSHRRSAQLF